MDMMQADTYVIEKDEKVNLLFSMLDEAIDDLENGRVIDEEAMWEELEYL